MINTLYGPFPGLTIRGTEVGILRLPLGGEQAREVVKVCSQINFGTKEKPIHDASTHNAWQLDPSQFQIMNARWNQMVPLISGSIIEALGLPPFFSISFQLFQMLLFEEGNSFRETIISF